LGDRHPDTLDSMATLAWMYWREERGRKEWNGLMETAFKGIKEVLGPEHPKTLKCFDNWDNMDCISNLGVKPKSVSIIGDIGKIKFDE